MGNAKVKDIYNLDYDRNTLNSGLIRWYNKLLDKTIEEIDVVDVSKMIRQNILIELAMNKIIELLMAHPFDGEINDGDLLDLFISIGVEKFMHISTIDELIKRFRYIEKEYEQFEWISKKDKHLFMENVNILKEKLASRRI